MDKYVVIVFLLIFYCRSPHLVATNTIILDFGPWSEWSACNGTCGEFGTQKRIRGCITMKCPDEIQEAVCHFENANCKASWSEWSNWSACSTFCGDGTRERTRHCQLSYKNSSEESILLKQASECPGEDKDTLPCTLRYNCRVDGQWSEWSKWGICDAEECSNNLGQQMRFRRCTNPRPMYGGDKCQGSALGTKPCYNNEYCSDPVDGEWCEWIPWSRCENQVQSRSRRCECPAPVNDGKQCNGGSEELQTCN